MSPKDLNGGLVTPKTSHADMQTGTVVVVDDDDGRHPFKHVDWCPIENQTENPWRSMFNQTDVKAQPWLEGVLPQLLAPTKLIGLIRLPLKTPSPEKVNLSQTLAHVTPKKLKSCVFKR